MSDREVQKLPEEMLKELEEALEQEMAHEGLSPEEPTPVKEPMPAKETKEAFSSEEEEEPLRRRRSRARGAGKTEKAGDSHREGQAPERTDEKGAGKSGKRKAMFMVCLILVLLLAAGGGYAAMSQQYRRVFFPGTQINGLEVSGRTVAEVKELIADGTASYQLTLEEREQGQEVISGEAIHLRSEFDGTLEKLLTSQNPYAWLSHQMSPTAYSIDTMIVYDEAELNQVLHALDCLNPQKMREPENAKLSDYVPGQGYQILPETEGTVVDEAALEKAVAEAILNLQETLSLEEAGAYQRAAVGAEDPSLQQQAEALNQYLRAVITYRFGDQKEILNGDQIHQWIVKDESGSTSLDETKVASYVEELAAKYNTVHKAKSLKTASGTVVEIKGGSYGWKINQAEETAQLAALIRSGTSEEREPVYSQKAAARGSEEYGNTYVEINLTAQHLYFYKDGALVVESDFVSGNLSRGWGTPAGSYPLSYNQKNAVLKGENYRTPVDYWMPFNGGIGMHDATWRGAFGGSIYKTSGSHGCINLPHSVAKKIYENISAGIPVLCYNLPGTEVAGTSAATPPATQPVTVPAETAAPAETTAPAETVLPQETQPAGPAGVPQTTAPAETKPAETAAPAETIAPAGPGSDSGNGGNGPASGLS